MLPMEPRQLTEECLQQLPSCHILQLGKFGQWIRNSLEQHFDMGNMWQREKRYQVYRGQIPDVIPSQEGAFVSIRT